MNNQEIDIDEIIRQKLSEAIKASGMTQGEITEKAKLGEVTLSRLITGARKGTTNATLAKVAKVLNLPISYFFGETSITDNSQSASADNNTISAGNGSQVITGSNIKDSTVTNGSYPTNNAKHKKVMELLPYATDNFLDKLIENLEKKKAEDESLLG